MEFLRHIFAFDSNSPLLFTQFYFWAFFALVYAVFAMIMEVGAHSAQAIRREDDKAKGRNTRLHLRNVFLMAVSWFFYYKTSGLFLLILLFVTLSDWLIAQQIYKAKGDEAERLLGYDHTGSFVDPTYAPNQEFWDRAARKKFKMLFKTSSKLHFVKEPVRITAKNEIADDLGAKIGWSIEFKWFAPNHPTIFDLGEFERFFRGCFEFVDE